MHSRRPASGTREPFFFPITPISPMATMGPDIGSAVTTFPLALPEGLEKEVSVQDVADLIAYLREAFGAAAAPGIVLFDDEPAFVSALDQGAGGDHL